MTATNVPSNKPPRYPSTAARIAAKTTPQGDCLIYTGGTTQPSGHALIRHDGQKVGVHRAAWIVANGPVPPGLVVRHSCDVPRCVNLAHLLLGTVADNNRDRHDRGRSRPAYGTAHPLAKLTWDDIPVIRERAAAGESQADIAASYGVSRPIIARVIRGTGWRHVA